MGLDVNLAGRRVLVTGASSGIGACTCRSIVACGGTVAMLARRKERLDDMVAELGGRAHAVPCDVTDLDTLRPAVDLAAEVMGAIDGVVAVAGRTVVGTLSTGTPEMWRDILDLNLIAPLATVRYAVGHFPRDGRRDVVLVGSAGALTPMVGVGIYAASKRGLLAAFDTLRLELAQSGVNVSSVLPGMFETEALSLEGLTFDGDMPADGTPWFAPGGGPASPDSLGESIAFMMSRPDGFCINQLVARPTRQLNP